MKTILYVFLIIAGISLIVSCTGLNTSSESTEVVIIRDITDTMAVTPNAEEITRLYGFDGDLWRGGNFRLVNLTDVSINKIFQTKIESENQWLSNKFKRKERLEGFYQDIEKILSEAASEKIGKEHSSIYLPIAKELNKLSESTADNKVLLVYSDLLENTDRISFYDKSTLELLDTVPQTIGKEFERQMELKNLSGIRICLIYQPADMKQDEAYKIVSAFYKNLFESKGASVEIVASIN